MFTGLITHIGYVRDVKKIADGMAMSIEAPPDFLINTKVGHSISISGACLTVISIGGESFSVDVSPETLSCTTISKWDINRSVNLEKALKADDRLGGHFVMGHVDGVGKLKASAKSGDGKIMTFECDSGIAKMIVVKGSVAVDGVSLTIADKKDDSFSIAIIPHTLKSTTLGHLENGSEVNIEVDILARYIMNFMENISAGSSKKPFGYDIGKLRDEGY